MTSIGIKRNNCHAFSLIEVLVTVALVAVLAVVAINVFNGVLANSKKRSDTQQAKNLADALRIFITDSSIANIIADKDKLIIDIAHDTALYIDKNFSGTVSLIAALQSTIYIKNPTSGVVKEYGPYLTNSAGIKHEPSDSSNGILRDKLYKSYQPQWSESAKVGEHTGYLFEIISKTYDVRCIPVTGSRLSSPTSFSTVQSPGILII